MQNKQKWHCFSHALIWNAKLKIWNIRFCKKKIPPEIILGKSHNLIHSLTHSCATNGLFSDILGILREISWSWYHDKRDNFPSSFDWKSTLGISHYSCHTFAFTQCGQQFFEVTLIFFLSQWYSLINMRKAPNFIQSSQNLTSDC